ncbi:prolyl hydroxylase family protein, partial [Comamonas thiooxydans]|uniref:prolyl hydroxylase family protein n=3 Tax=Comamonadaceae TaxID=80864 RepID=UPI00050F7200
QWFKGGLPLELVIEVKKRTEMMLKCDGYQSIGNMRMKLMYHTDRVFSIPSFLEIDKCSELIALSEARVFSAAEVRTSEGQKPMPNVRNNDRTTLEDPVWVNFLWRRFASAALPQIENELPVGLPKDLRFYKYTQGQRFKMHKDGPWKEDGLTSHLTFLVYLNDGFSGGETDFRDFKISPKAGDALLFIHDTWHEGAAVTSGVKYVLRSDVMYRATAVD